MLKTVFKSIAGLGAVLLGLNVIGRYNTLLETSASLKWLGDWWHFFTSLPFTLFEVDLSEWIVDAFAIYVMIAIFAFRSSLFETGSINSLRDLRAAVSLIATGGPTSQSTVSAVIAHILAYSVGAALFFYVMSKSIFDIIGFCQL